MGQGFLSWIERTMRRGAALFSRDPEALWLRWARDAHHGTMARWCLDQAVRHGGAEALFQEGLAFLEGGMGAGGQGAGSVRLRMAAARGHAEAAFCLAEILRTGQAGPGDPQSAEAWYQRSAAAGFGPATAWLARAYELGDGVVADAAKARRWAGRAAALEPHRPLTQSPLRHDAGQDDPLVQLGGKIGEQATRRADRVLAHRLGRWAMALLTVGLGGGALLVGGSFFWVGSSRLFHLPLLFLTPPLLILGWLAWQLRREGPRRGRDRLREAAERGDPEACFQLGLAHRKGGPHLPKDDLGAALWFRKAADAGHSGAMAALAEAYLGGHGVVRNPREAARWAEAVRRESTS